MKMPIVKVTHEEGRKLVAALYDLGYRQTRIADMAGEDGAWQSLLNGHDPHLTHIWLYSGHSNRFTIWCCGPNRSLERTMRDTDYNLTMVNSPAHMLAYIKRHGLHP